MLPFLLPSRKTKAINLLLSRDSSCTRSVCIMPDERTIYNYVDAGLLSVGNIDLHRKVRYKIRKKKPSVRVDKQYHLGRSYEDFLEYTAINPDVPIVEIDKVEGRKDGKVLLTVFYLMLAFLREGNTVFERVMLLFWNLIL